MDDNNLLHIIGGGLAGCEAAWQAAQLGISVKLYEMRPITKTDVHKTKNLAELVCSNSFRSDDSESNAVGLLHDEMRKLNSIIMKSADKTKIPAGSALAVDRENFSKEVEKSINYHPNINVIRKEIKSIDFENWKNVIIATGPLTSDSFSNVIKSLTGEKYLAFFDALAPIVYYETIDMNTSWFQSRYDKGNGKDYINCPLNKKEYYFFVSELLKGEKVKHENNLEPTPYFEGCMPIEIMAERGIETLRFGPMKPVGLTNPHKEEKPYAVVQLRQDNLLGTLFNIVGFQTKLNYSEQVRIFKLIPGLNEAKFARLGGLHRNTFINSPKLLDNQLKIFNNINIRFAGQITGVEGYVESSAIGGLAGRMAAFEILKKKWMPPPINTAHGALLNHITKSAISSVFQPMNINFGLFPPINDQQKNARIRSKEKKHIQTTNAKKSLNNWILNTN